jgi:hypothetical protein
VYTFAVLAYYDFNFGRDLLQSSSNFKQFGQVPTSITRHKEDYQQWHRPAAPRIIIADFQ